MKASIYIFQRINYLNLKSIRQKVCTYLLSQQHLHESCIFDIKRSRQELADYLNIPRTSLSRELCILRDLKLIDFYKSTFKIIDSKKLESFSQQNTGY